ncbi:hypothetical protein GOP47_0026853 [Adiantum capillus-veneris]|nr:hypothetical protein GOP47_0026853 [Adiantum capillus-veneris]
MLMRATLMSSCLNRSRALSCGCSQLASSSNVVIADPTGLQLKIDGIRRCGGLSKLQVIADFDMTLTKYLVDGKRGQSSHSLLNQGNPEYDMKRQLLFDHYYPLEISPTIPLPEKTKLMEEWWEKTHCLLVEGGLSRQAIVESVARAKIEFRDGVNFLLQFLQDNSVPVLIFSAGLSDIIEEVMHQKLGRKFANVRIVSNKMEFDSNDNLIGFKGKTIHVLNKNEHALGMSSQHHGLQTGSNPDSETDVSALKRRTNVLLLGDHLGDLGMSDGLDYKIRISVGFLNENVDSWIEEYKRSFDIVLLHGETMGYVTNLVKDLQTQSSGRFETTTDT